MKLLSLALSLILSAPTAPDTFAIACSGEIFSSEVQDRRITEKNFRLPDQIFVFSQSAGIALRAMPRMERFENLCEIQTSGRSLEFSVDMIRAYWSSPPDWDAKTSCEFKLNRIEDVASMRTKFEWTNSHYRESEWRMNCTPTQIPVFAFEER